MKTSAPLIGVTQSVLMDGDELRHSARPFYADCVIAVGGIPVYLPPTEDVQTLTHYVERLDGLLLSGGADLPPDAYGAESAPETNPMRRERYDFERQLIDLWLQTNKPVLGICLGCQFVNAVLGGTLLQHIPREVGTEIVHTAEKDVWHDVRILQGSRLAAILGNEEVVRVNSSHHQAVLKPGVGLYVVATAPDGVIEALESNSPEVFRILVQWHPERMVNTNVQRQLFSALVEAAR